MEKPQPSSLNFLSAGGELGALMRSHDWAATSLGLIEHWPRSLKTAVGIMLNSRQPIWIGWGDELIYLYNDAYKAIIGGKHPWALGKPTATVWWEIWPDIGPMLATAMQGDEGIYVEAQLLIMERNGYPEETYYTFSYTPIPDDEGGVGGIFCANSDDTQRVIGERQLSLLRELATSTADARTWREACVRSGAALSTNPHDLPFALIYLAEEGKPGLTLAAACGIEHGHPAALDTLTAAASMTWPFEEVLRDNQPRLASNTESLFGSDLPYGAWDQPARKAVVLPLPASGDTGRSGVMVVGLNPFRLFDESYRGFLGLVAGQVAAAIANAQAYEQERRRAETLAEVDRAKTTFFSNVSHEFRTPLTLMLGPLEEALAAPPAELPGRRGELEIVHRNSLRLLRLVNSLLDFARVEAGRAQAVYEPVDLASFTAELASTFRSACERAGLSLSLDCPSLGCLVHVDRDMWEKVVLNLISNAFKFTLHGEIQISLKRVGEEVELSVRDSGGGIPEAELPRLFERFHRIDGAQGRSHEGSGIGLALVHELVKLHGGHITVESKLTQGSVFKVLLPLGTAHLPADRVRMEQASTSVPARASAYADEALRWLPDTLDQNAVEERAIVGIADADRRLSQKRPRVLLADDSADMRDYLRRLLEGSYEIEAVEDGRAAIEAARRAPPNLVLTDVMMPQLDGFELVRALRQDFALRDIPIIMLSARAGEEAEVEGLEAGADDYLVKPFSARELLARVGANIKLAQTRSESALALRESERWSRELLGALPVAVYTTDKEGRITFYNQAAVTLWGYEPKLGEARWCGSWKLYWPDGSPLPHDQCPMAMALKENRPKRGFEAIAERPDGTRVPFIPYPTPLTGPDGNLIGAVNMLVDITDRKAAELALSAESHRLETLNNVGTMLAGELDLERVVQLVTDAGVKLTGAQFGAFFYNVLNDAGESYTLYTLSGVERSAFEGFPMPRNTAVFGPTFRGEGVVRSADITEDPRYGKNVPRRGMPEGHLPVRSYLAVPVMSRTGEVLGGLFFGHPEPGIFTEAAERVMTGIAGQAAIAVDNARLYQTAQDEIVERGRAEVKLRDLNETLESRVVDEIGRRRKAEAALQQAQKMEAIGQLTGGIAHDFNNLLQIISGNLQLLTKDVAGNGRAEVRLQNALAGVSRGAKLSSQLLSFGRRQPLEPKVINVGRLVRGLDDMLRRALGEQVEIETTVAGGLWNTFADPGQIENAALNLAINARDAMEGNGKLTIEVGNAFLDDNYAANHSEVTAGQYVVLAVTDTGCGIAPELIDKVFEPFFSTKPEGKGTGLGLSMVFGFVKQSGGHIKIYSEVGHGTTIKLYLPRVIEREDAEIEILSGPITGGSETVLVVEDDEEVRATVVDTLNDLGYNVLKAHDAAAALTVIESGVPIDLLFTDVVMPGKLKSPELARKVRQRLPAVAVLFTSGYTENAIVHGGRLDEGVQLISKPYTRDSLARKIRHVLANQQRRNAAGDLSQVLKAAGPERLSMPVTQLMVLLVEDDPLIRMNTAALLQDLGYVVVEANNAEEALAALDTSAIDVLLTDIELPRMSGDELAGRARALRENIGVVFASGRNHLPVGWAADRRTVLLQKPYDQAGLAKSLQRVSVRFADGMKN